MVTFTDLVERIKSLMRLETDSEVAEWLGISVADLYNRRRRNILPLKRLVQVSEKHNIDVRALLYGRGPTVRNNNHSKIVGKKQ